MVPYVSRPACELASLSVTAVLSSDDFERDAAWAAGLGFETTEDLAQLALRLSCAGYPAQVVEEHGARSVRTVDPDGEHVEIHPRPHP